jgi:hypothetical protein
MFHTAQYHELATKSINKQPTHATEIQTTNNHIVPTNHIRLYTHSTPVAFAGRQYTQHNIHCLLM